MEDSAALIQLVYEVYEDPSLLEDRRALLIPMLARFTASAPKGFEGMAVMINTHISNALKFKSPNVQKFELESGLIKLKTYCRKLGV